MTLQSKHTRCTQGVGHAHVLTPLSKMSRQVVPSHECPTALTMHGILVVQPSSCFVFGARVFPCVASAAALCVCCCFCWRLCLRSSPTVAPRLDTLGNSRSWGRWSLVLSSCLVVWRACLCLSSTPRLEPLLGSFRTESARRGLCHSERVAYLGSLKAYALSLTAVRRSCARGQRCCCRGRGHKACRRWRGLTSSPDCSRWECCATGCRSSCRPRTGSVNSCAGRLVAGSAIHCRCTRRNHGCNNGGPNLNAGGARFAGHWGRGGCFRGRRRMADRRCAVLTSFPDCSRQRSCGNRCSRRRSASHRRRGMGNWCARNHKSWPDRSRP